MPHLVRGAAFVAAALVCIGTGAQQVREPDYRWTPVYAATDAIVEVDLARVRPLAGGQSRVWTRWFWSRPLRHGEIEYTVSVILSDLDCDAVSSRRFVTVYKDAGGEIVFVEELEPEQVAWQPFAPGSPGEAVARRICALIAEPADLVLLNARVHTLAWGDPLPDGTTAADAPVDAAGALTPTANAVAIRDGLIIAVGAEEELRGYVGAETRTVDLGGAALVPGLVESHAHVAELGRNLRRIDLTGVQSERELVARVVEAAARRDAGEWLLGWGFDDGEWADRYGDNRLLSERVPEHPVLLSGLHGFAVWLNDAALERAGIDADTPDPPGGRILRRLDGTPSGILLDRARTLLDGAVPVEGSAQVAENLVAGLQELARAGYVAAHEAGADAVTLDALERLDAEGRLPIRVYAMLSARDEALGRAWIGRGPLTYDGVDGRLTVRSVKAYYDAALGSRGARLLADYADLPGHRGTAGEDYGFDRALVRDLMRAGFQVGVHAIGDAGNREALDYLAGVFDAYPETRAGRHRIEHAQVLHPDDLPRLAELGVIASMEPPHAVEDMDWAEDRLGPDRVLGAYAWRALRLTGAELAFNSDLPGSDHSIFYGLHAAVTRRDENEQPPGGWYAEQAVSPEEALRAYTLWGARAAFQEELTGSIEVGKWADLTALRPDPLSLSRARYGEILAGRIVLTIVGGEVVADPGNIAGGDRR